MNAICTICAKNYLAQAITLGKSIKKYHPEIHFFIVLSDVLDKDFNQSSVEFKIIEANSIGIENFDEMAFKYDVIEFSTAIKPFLLERLFSKYQYEKILYIDPDMVVYNRVDDVLAMLDSKDIVITPHILKPYIKFEGTTPEEELLFVGIYNLGFIGLKCSSTTSKFLAWWKEKLKNQCYADRFDALHVDQKWIDFIPALFGDSVGILRHPGYNLATWNLHERNVELINGKVTIDGTHPLVLYHFSGFTPREPNLMNKKQFKYTLENVHSLREVFEQYTKDVFANGYECFSKMKYAYNSFNNGLPITRFQRRLYRALLKRNVVFNNPFDVQTGSYYDLLNKRKMLVKDRNGSKWVSQLVNPPQNLPTIRKSVKSIDRNVKMMQMLFFMCKKIIGIKNYALLMHYLMLRHRFEDQVFLLIDINKNEN